MHKEKTTKIKYYIYTLIISVTAVFGLSMPKITVYAASGSTIVYTTNTGKCYHNSGCSTLSKSKNETTLEMAVGSGLTPCSKCKPPKLESNTSSSDNSQKKDLPDKSSGTLVWKSATGSCYHSKNNCGKMNPSKAKQISESDAKSQGLTKCSKCW